MTRYLLKRLTFSLITLFAVITVVFFLLRIAPGGPFDGERQLPPEIEANLKAAYNLDEPLYRQFALYLGRLVTGDLGPSFRQKDFDVNELVSRGLPVSTALGISALLLAVLAGMAVGTLAGLHPGKPLDVWLMSLSNLNLAIPTIVAGPVLILIFAVFLRWVPAGGSGTFTHFVLPVIALALPYVAAVARLIRGGIVSAGSEPHVTTARAKGLSPGRIVGFHMLPTASIPLISFLGPAAAGLLTGSVVVEQIFDLPGIGRYFVQGALARDYTLVMGVVVVYSTAILLFNFLADVAYGLVDPRIRAL